MKRMIKRCAGLDVHQATVVACVLIHEGRKPPRSEVRSFGTMTHERQALRDWLAAERVSHVGMESTGVYWRPVYAVLEGHFGYLKDKFHRLKARRGAKRAEVAIAHKMLVAACHMLSCGVGYHDLGEAYLDQIDQTRTAANLKRRLERLGYVISIQPKEAVPNPVEAAA